MIFESYYWKRELQKNVGILKGKLKQKRWMPSTFAQIELALLNSAYIIRRLLESRKLSTKLEQRTVKLTKFLKHQGSAKTNIRNRHEVDKLFNLQKPYKVDIPLKRLVNIIIHSYIYEVVGSSKGGLQGFYLTSDKEKDSHVYYLSAEQAIQIFLDVSMDNPSRVRMVRNVETGDFEITND